MQAVIVIALDESHVSAGLIPIVLAYSEGDNGVMHAMNDDGF